MPQFTEPQIAQLSPPQLAKVQDLEKKLGDVVIVAYQQAGDRRPQLTAPAGAGAPAGRARHRRVPGGLSPGLNPERGGAHNRAAARRQLTTSAPHRTVGGADLAIGSRLIIYGVKPTWPS